MDYEAARINMIETQVRPNGVTDPRVLAAMLAVPRELFVPQDLRPLAYMDEDVLIGKGEDDQARYMIEPMNFARLLKMAGVRAGDLVLDIGCGTGYSTAILAQLGESVIALEADAGLGTIASETLERLGVTNAVVVTGPHAAGLPDEAPYDVIFLNGRVPEVPDGLLNQLRDGGRLVAPLGEGIMAQLGRWVRFGDSFSCRTEFDGSVELLPGFEVQRPVFQF